MRQFPACVLAIVLASLMPWSVIAWGPQGHEVVAALAQTLLTETARNGVQSLIGTATLASVANWADQIRTQRDETYNWHFVDIPRSVSTFSEPRDCFLPNNRHAGATIDHQNCVVDRINLFKQILADPSASQNTRVEALKFVVHFVADVHQPFHAIGDASGANGIRVSEFGSTICGQQPCNLHATWDSGLIQHTGMALDAYVQHLEQLILSEHLTASGNPEDWANESHGFAQAAWLGNGGQIDEQYYQKEIKVIDERLALAGLRLAAVLNAAFGQTQSSITNLESSTMAQPGSSATEPSDQISENWDKPEPNKTTLTGPDGDCPWNGNGADPDTFVRKNRSDVPDDSAYHDVKWSAIHDLPFPTDRPLRVNWTPVHLQEIARYEGVPIRTVGYIAAYKPQSGHGEGTNCGFTLPSETDTHMALVGTFGDAEGDSVVIEFTPRFLQSHPNWNRQILSKYVNANTQVRISGWLLLDPDHRNHLDRYRHTLWEIHPITKIEVFSNGQWVEVGQNN